MHLIVNAAVAHKDLESSLITPVVVPGVDTEPVVLTIFDTPADHLDSMTTKLLSGHVLVNTRGISFEVLVYSESSSDSTVGHDFHLDIINTTDTVGRGTLNFISIVYN